MAQPAHRSCRSMLQYQRRSTLLHEWAGWRLDLDGIGRPCPPDQKIPAMPFKANAARRHRIPKQRYRVTNWAEYDAALRQRGSLTVWFSEEAIAAWRAEPRTTRGGQPHYSALAIRTALTLRAVFRLALRQTEGLIGSILRLLGLDLAVPDHSTLSRRAETLEVPRPVHAPGRFICWSTAQACSCVEPASGWSRSMAPGDADPGASCTSVLMLRPGRSSPQS